MATKLAQLAADRVLQVCKVHPVLRCALSSPDNKVLQERAKGVLIQEFDRILQKEHHLLLDDIVELTRAVHKSIKYQETSLGKKFAVEYGEIVKRMITRLGGEIPK